MTAALDSTDLDSEERRKLRDELLGSLAFLVQDLAGELADGSITLEDWEDEMRDQIKNALGAAYVFGRGGLGQMTDGDWETLSKLVVVAYMHLDQFAFDIEQARLSEAVIAARSELYIGAGVGAYERGAAAEMDLDLPVYPGDDCEGMTNCRCGWDLQDQEDGSIEAYWICESDKESCDTCLGHAEEFNPLFIVVAGG
jgi:hypothetical protein